MGRSIIDMKGQVIERLTVLSLNQKATKEKKKAIWICQCQCGNIVNVYGTNLRNGTTKSCGCLRKEISSKNTVKDLVNKQFGKLTVIKDTGKRINNRVIWLCKCECGNFYEVDTNRLTAGNTKSCGCLHKEIISNLMKKDLTNQRFGKLTALYPTDKRADNKVIWACKCDCGNYCEVKSANLLSGKTSSCGCIKSSIGESNIINLLQINNINYCKEYRFSDLKGENDYLRYDFYLFDYNRLIEFDGEQHYKDTGWHTLNQCQKYDKLKNEYALQHNIPLVRIPYWERDNITIEMILGDQYLVKGE